MISINSLAQYICIDYYEDDPVVTANLQRAIDSATYRLYGSVGRDVETYLPGDARIEELLLMYGEESYDDHTGSAKQASSQRHLRDLYESQLRLELRRAKEEGAPEESEES